MVLRGFSRFVLELLLTLPCCIAKQLLMSIEFRRNIFRLQILLKINWKAKKWVCGARHGQNYVPYCGKALKTGFFIFCKRNKVKSVVLVVRNTSVEIFAFKVNFVIYFVKTAFFCVLSWPLAFRQILFAVPFSGFLKPLSPTFLCKNCFVVARDLKASTFEGPGSLLSLS